MSERKGILMICLGNICRSPIAGNITLLFKIGLFVKLNTYK